MASNGSANVDDDAPPGFHKPAPVAPKPVAESVSDISPPPGNFGVPAKQTSPADLTDALQKAKLEEQVDDPDLALRLDAGLQERHDAAITTTTAGNSIYQSAATFEELNLSPELLKGLYVEMKFERPSRIQATTLPMILTPPYKDLIAQAHNGSGKTTCFTLAMLSRVDPALRQPQALCICPTRELAVQNLSVLQRIGKFSGITSASTAGDADNQSGFRKEVIREQVVIGTHGKIKAWHVQRLLPLDHVRILVFDEADEMLKKDGFLDDSVRLINTARRKNPHMQLLLFSATFNDKVKRMAEQISRDANHVFVQKEQLSLDVIAQYNVRCATRDAKTRVLKEMIFPNCEKLGQTIIFVRSRDMATTLHTEMTKEGYKCTSIRGDLEHSQRDRIVQEFRDGTTKILISTDVLSRGFDVSQVTLVVNYDVPVERDDRTPAFETYLHRIGRSGRFGRKGIAFNLMCGPQDDLVMQKISLYFNKTITEIPWDDEEKFVEVLEASL